MIRAGTDGPCNIPGKEAEAVIYLVRHGQTAMNRKKVLQGRSDFPLNEEGRREAAEVGERLKKAGIVFDRVYSSPLVRARETAELITDAPIITDGRLIEMDYGPYEGMELMHPSPEVLAFFSDFANHPAPQGMEALPDVVRRLGEFLEEIRGEAGKKTILLSTHAIAMKGALEYLTPDSRGAWWSRYIGNCAVYRTGTREDGSWILPSLWE